MKKKVVSVMLASALIVSCLAGCGNSGSDSTSDDGAATTDSSADSSGGGK